VWLELDRGKISERIVESKTMIVGWPFPTKTALGSYICQATSISGATSSITVLGKLRLAISDVVHGQWPVRAFVKSYSRALIRRLKTIIRRSVSKFFGQQSTPVEILSLEPGELVEVKTFGEIAITLDRQNRNRGLEFSAYMLPYCGGVYRVKARVHAFIDERSGLMRELKNTVVLEGVTCGGDTTAGLCRRSEYLYWREIWLRRVSPT
jgi:hypothetical protein